MTIERPLTARELGDYLDDPTRDRFEKLFQEIDSLLS
jgi:hypothetical protein